jgi:multicomponent Na+:H+ antiporter subunit C
MDVITSLAIAAMFGIGVFQLLRRNVVRSALAFVILSNAINLFLLSVGAYDGLIYAYAKATGQRSDALPLALILTAIVISMGAFAFVLAMLRILAARYKINDLDKLNGLKN